MHGDEVVRDYLLIAEMLECLLPGTVDAFGGDPRLRDEVRRTAPTASGLVRAAGELAGRLPASMDPARARFLRGQLTAVEWTARRLAGQAVPFVEEVEAAFGVRIAPGSEDVYRAAHRELDALLPGPGSLAERVAGHRRRDEIPPERLGAAVAAMMAALRERTAERMPLPVGESVGFRVVADAPWTALHQYRGGFRSEVTVNAAARIRRGQLPQLLAHEVYPGHHAERCRKEAGLVARGWGEHRLVLANTPQSLIAEGAAELGMEAVVGQGWGPWAADVLAGVGLPFDGELAERLDGVMAVLGRVRQDAALLLHDRKAPEADVRAHLERWLLVGEERAGQVLRFLRHPLWRAYNTSYVEGAALMRAWWEQGPRDERFRRLLDEPLTPAAVRAELGSSRIA